MWFAGRDRFRALLSPDLLVVTSASNLCGAMPRPCKAGDHPQAMPIRSDTRRLCRAHCLGRMDLNAAEGCRALVQQHVYVRSARCAVHLAGHAPRAASSRNSASIVSMSRMRGAWGHAPLFTLHTRDRTRKGSDRTSRPRGEQGGAINDSDADWGDPVSRGADGCFLLGIDEAAGHSEDHQ